MTSWQAVKQGEAALIRLHFLQKFIKIALKHQDRFKSACPGGQCWIASAVNKKTLVLFFAVRASAVALHHRPAPAHVLTGD
jgi:hypothetical protein